MIDQLAGKRVFVTGATGFIGGHLVQRLHTVGAHVLALERTPGKGKELVEMGIEIVRGDITDHSRMTEIIDQGIQIVMHIAAWLSGRSPQKAKVVNVVATRHLAQAAADADVERFVYTSSVAVYGPHGDIDVNETTLLYEYNDLYGDTKIHSERALREVSQHTGLDYAIIRPGMVYGPGSPGWTKRIALWAKKGQIPLIGSGRGTVYPIYIDNLTDLLMLCAVHPSAIGEVFNGVDDGPVTLIDFLGGYMRMIPTERAIRLPCWLAQVVAVLADPFTRYNLPYVMNQMCGQGWISNQKAKDILGWKPGVSLEEGLRHSEDWLHLEGIL